METPRSTNEASANRRYSTLEMWADVLRENEAKLFADDPERESLVTYSEEGVPRVRGFDVKARAFVGVAFMEETILVEEYFPRQENRPMNFYELNRGDKTIQTYHEDETLRDKSDRAPESEKLEGMNEAIAFGKIANYVAKFADGKFKSYEAQKESYEEQLSAEPTIGLFTFKPYEFQLPELR